MSVQFDLYVRRHSWIHALDPRVKLLFVVEAGLLPFLWPTIWSSALVIVVCLAGFWQAQIPRRQVTGIARMMGPLLGLVFGLTVLFGEPNPAAWFQIGPLVISPASVMQAAMLTLRLLALALIVFLWLFTTDQATMVRGFQAVGVPYNWGLTLALALRYLPIFSGLFQQVREAQQARGLNLEQRGFLQRLRSYRPVLVAMTISALRQSEHLGWALEARGLGANEVRRTVFHPLRLRRADYAGFLVLAVVFVISIALRFQ